MRLVCASSQACPVPAAGRRCAAQPGPAGPPVGRRGAGPAQPVIETSEFVGRIQAVNRVDLVARVTAFLEQRAVHRRRRGQGRRHAVPARARPVRGAGRRPGGRRGAGRRGAAEQPSDPQPAPSSCSTRRPGSAAASTTRRPRSAARRPSSPPPRPSCARRRSTSTTPRSRRRSTARSAAPPSPRATSSTPSTGTLATIVSQDPMYVLFPVSVRAALDLRDRYADKGGFGAVKIKLRLPNGKLYDQDGPARLRRPHRRAEHRHAHLPRAHPQPAPPRRQKRRPRRARAERRRVRHRPAPGRRADPGARHPARRDPVRPAGQLRLGGRRRQQGRAAPGPARPEHAGDGGDRRRASRKARPWSWTACSACGPASSSRPAPATPPPAMPPQAPRN